MTHTPKRFRWPRLRAARRPPQRPPRDLAWTFAAVTGGLGVLFLVLLQMAPTRPTAGAVDPAPRTAAVELPARLSTPMVEREPDPPAPPAVPEPELFTLDFQRLPEGTSDEFVVSAETAPPPPEMFDHQPSAVFPPDGWGDWDRFDHDRTDPAAAGLPEFRAVADPAESLLDAGSLIGDDAVSDGRPGEVRLAVSKRLPERGVVHQPLDYEILIRNDGDKVIEHVLLEDRVAPEHRVAEVSDGGALDRETLRWRLRGLGPGDERRVTVRVIPTATGSVESMAMARPFASVTATTLVQSAKLQLEVIAPERVRIGAACPLIFKVSNTGPVPATGVVIREDLPPGLEHPLGRELDYEVGTLAPGETCEARLMVLAAEAGTAVNRAEAVADGGLIDVATGDIEVHHPSFSIRRVGWERIAVGRVAEYTNHVTNETEDPLEGVEILEHVPVGMEVVQIAQDGTFDPLSRTVRWRLPAIDPGDTAQVAIRLRPTRPGVEASEVFVENARERLGPLVAAIQVEAAPEPPPGSVPYCPW